MIIKKPWNVNKYGGVKLLVKFQYFRIMAMVLRFFILMTMGCGLFYEAGAQAAAPKSKPGTCGIVSHSKVVDWVNISNVKKIKLPPKSGQRKLPLHYLVYTTNEKQLKDFLVAVKSQPTVHFEIALPSPDFACHIFSLTNSGTMSEALAAKFPELVSLKGISREDKSSGLRLDYDGKTMNAEVTWMGKTYFIAPWEKGKKVYYLVYKKEDTGIEKRPFESR